MTSDCLSRLERKMVSRWVLTKKTYEMSRVSCLLVSLFQKPSRLYPCMTAIPEASRNLANTALR